jgi:hypothetical protein
VTLSAADPRLVTSEAERPEGGGTVLERIDELLGRRVSMRSLALLRILIGPVVLLHLRPFVDDALDGRIYRDSFYEPYAAWYPELPRALYSGLLYLGLVAAVALSLGIATRLTSAVTFGVVAYNLFLSTTHVHNNRAFLVIVLAGLAGAPCGRELSVDAWWRRRRGRPPLDRRAPGWPLWLLRFEASVLYGASGLSKLLDPDWFGGTVTWHRVTQHRDDMLASPLPGWAVDLLLERGFHTFAAKVIVLTELAIAAGLWSQRTRYAAVWLAVCFHVSIQLTASVEVFSYLAVAALVIWAVPSPGDRTLALDLSRASHRRLATAVHRLDWLARFHILDAPTSSPPPAAPRHHAPPPTIAGASTPPGGPARRDVAATGADAAPGASTPPGGAFRPDAAPTVGGAAVSGGSSPSGGSARRNAAPTGDGAALDGSTPSGRGVVPDGSVSSGGDVGGDAGATGGALGGVAVVDRDGTGRGGGAAVVFVLSRLPLTAWFALPALLLPTVRRDRASGPRGEVGAGGTERVIDGTTRAGEG